MYSTEFYWNGPGWYSGPSDINSGARFYIGSINTPLNEVNKYCRDRMYDTPRLYLEKPEEKNGIYFPDE